MNLEDAVYRPLSESLMQLIAQGCTHGDIGGEFVSCLLAKPERRPSREDLQRLLKHEKDQYQYFIRTYFAKAAGRIQKPQHSADSLLFDADLQFRHKGTSWTMEHAVLDLLSSNRDLNSLGRAVLDGSLAYSRRDGVGHKPYAEYNSVYSAIRKEAANKAVALK